VRLRLGTVTVFWLFLCSSLTLFGQRNTAAISRITTDASGAVIGADVEPSLFSDIGIREGMQSLKYLLDTPVKSESAADLFFLDLFKAFDIDQLAMWRRRPK
jgi:hypothetical protein